LALEAIKHVSLFGNLSPLQLDAIASKMELLIVAPQTSVLTQGHPGQFLYVIKKGILNAYRLDDSGKENLIAKLTPPDSFGELSFLFDSPCAASVRSTEDCELWQFDRSCLDGVSEEDKTSYIEHKKSQYSRQTSKKTDKVSMTTVADDDVLTDSFGVLMWFYQIVGIMLSVTSPLSYIDGSAVAYSIISFFVNAKPSSESASDVATRSSPATDANDRDSSFQFCVDRSYTFSQLYVTTFGYYAVWAFLIVILLRRRVWRFLRGIIISTSIRWAQFLDFVSSITEVCHFSASFSTRQQQYAARQAVDIEIRGPVMLKWLISCFNAVAILLMQGTACFRLDGFPDAAGKLRWIYDGRVACFSNDGDFQGRWQIASAFGVAIVLAAPTFLWRMMVRIQSMEKRTPFQDTLLQAYSGAHSSNARHWKVVM
jgi:hypothetical protein